MSIISSFFELLGQVGGPLALLISVPITIIGMVYFYVRLRPADEYEGTAGEALQNREDYTALRGDLVNQRTFGEAYGNLLQSSLDLVERFFEGEIRKGKVIRQFWGVKSLDRCILLALFYPILGITLVYNATGDIGQVEGFLGFNSLALQNDRVYNFLLILLLLSAVIIYSVWDFIFKNNKSRVFIFLSVIPIALITSFLENAETSIFVIASLVVMVVIGTVKSFQGISILSILFMFYIFNVLELYFDFDRFIPYIIILFIPILLFLFNILINHVERVLSTVYILMILSIFALQIFAFSEFPTNEGGLLLLIMFGILPVINGLFDWLSLGFTRFVLRMGLNRGGATAIGLATIDLIVAFIALSALVALITLIIALLNQLVEGNLINIRLLLEQFSIKEKNIQPNTWWIYIMIFTTLVPSLINISIALLAFGRSMLGWLTRRVAEELLPLDPRRLNFGRRVASAAGLTCQWVIAGLIASLVIGVVGGILYYGIQLIFGPTLLDIAWWAHNLVIAAPLTAS